MLLSVTKNLLFSFGCNKLSDTLFNKLMSTLQAVCGGQLHIMSRG